MRKLFIKIGNLTALLFLFLPLVILACSDKFSDIDVFVFLFFSIAYDFYYYNKIMQFDSYMEEQKENTKEMINENEYSLIHELKAIDILKLFELQNKII